jgi:hypothetical protein
MMSLQRLRGRNFITRTMDLVCFSKTSVSTFISARRQISDDNYLNNARCAGLKNYGHVNVLSILYFQSATAQVLIFWSNKCRKVTRSRKVYLHAHRSAQSKPNFPALHIVFKWNLEHWKRRCHFSFLLM